MQQGARAAASPIEATLMRRGTAKPCRPPLRGGPRHHDPIWRVVAALRAAKKGRGSGTGQSAWRRANGCGNRLIAQGRPSAAPIRHYTCRDSRAQLAERQKHGIRPTPPGLAHRSRLCRTDAGSVLRLRLSWANFFRVGKARSPRQRILGGRATSKYAFLAGVGSRGASLSGRAQARAIGRVNPPRQPGLPRRFSRRI